MPVTRNLTPDVIHGLWDILERTAGPTPVEGLNPIPDAVVTKESMVEYLVAAAEEGLVVKESTGGTDLYALPEKKDPPQKGDHDWYCFKCHLGGSVVACEDCPRVFHIDCLPENRKPDKDLFVCPPCHLMATKPSATKVNVKQKQLNTLLGYICNRFKEWEISFLDKFDGKGWAEGISMDAKAAWRINYLVYFPMDLSTMIEKANAGKYLSLEEFQVDAETIVHGVACYFGRELIKAGVIIRGFGGVFIREIIHDIDEIKLCHDCFRRSNEKDHPWWFCLPCATPHSTVFANQRGYPYWPAKVMKIEGAKYDVRYFGGNYKRALIDSKNILPIETDMTNKVKKTAGWNQAYDELQKFLEIAENPDKINDLPDRKSGGARKSGGGSLPSGKRGGSSGNDDTPPTKKVKTSLTPTNKMNKSSVGKGKGTPSSKSTSSSNTPVKLNNGTSGSQKTKSSGGSGGSKPSLTRRESINRQNSGPGSPQTPKVLLKPAVVAANLQEMDTAFLDKLFTMTESEMSLVEETEKAENGLGVKDAEDGCADSSSSIESRNRRTVYLQTGSTSEFRAEIEKYIKNMRQGHANELSLSKKRQWCFHCEKEAIYHCCWNTAYCSIDCQQAHWSKEHKRLCRRIRRAVVGASPGTGGGGQSHFDDY